MYATSVDYNPQSEESIQFFKIVQNKLHYAAHGHTAAEVIYERADAENPFMGLKSFSGELPALKDIGVAKNYLKGHKCDYKKQIHEEMLDEAVAEVIKRLVSNKKFADLMRQKINMEVDTSALDQEISAYEKQLRQCYSNKDSIMSDLDSLDYDDKHYKRRKADLDDRLYCTYDKMDEMENLIAEAKAKRRSILADKMSGDNIYKALIFFDKLYEKMSETEKRAFYEKLIKEV